MDQPQRSTYVGRHTKRVQLDKVFDPENPAIKKDIIRLIAVYLQKEGYSAASLTLQDEANVKLHEHANKRSQVKRVRQAILDGDWETVRKLASKLLIRRNSKSMLYSIYRQEYLELIDRQEYQRAFIFLTKRLKPVESLSHVQGSEQEFQDLCYLLTCRSVQDAKSFSNWGGVTSSREQLADQFEAMFVGEFENTFARGTNSVQSRPEADRLTRLLQQAFAYQMEFNPYHPQLEPTMDTLLEDFHCRVIPNTEHRCYVGHTNNVKCVEYLGEDGRFLASGSSDRTICVWATDSLDAPSSDPCDEGEDRPTTTSVGASVPTAPQTKPLPKEPEVILFGHTSRIWDLSSDRSGRWLTSASGDGTVRLWDLDTEVSSAGAGGPTPGSEQFPGVRSSTGRSKQPSSMIINSLDSRASDRPGATGTFVSSSSMTDGNGSSNPQSSTMRVNCDVIDTGHDGDVYSVQFHHDQTKIVTAGYDKTVRLIDVSTGKSLRTFYGHTAGVTHAVFNPIGNLVVTGSKDSTIKFWDSLSGACVKTISQLHGEVTSLEISKNGLHLLSGSKDSSNRLWDIRTCKPIVRYKGHQNTARNFIRASFGPRDEIVMGGSEDGRVHIWDTNTGQLLERLHGHVGPIFRSVWNDNQSLMATCSDDSTVRTWYQGQVEGR